MSRWDAIARWSMETFGEPIPDSRVAARANLEMAELLTKVTDPRATSESIVDECADVAIVLARICYHHGTTLEDAVDRKMELNRNRQWDREAWRHR